ncbi:MAG: Eco57I restriction-modification methylase domain-containing protein [Candidatus Aenigmatarchaeota archaeon]|nr:Eco57I restriction-modification methylase domain-containing protein [Candidatus Aenigmarchaeota archaeon]
MSKYDINWLKEKGFFEKPISLRIEDRDIFLDGNNLIAYAEVFSNEEVEKIRKKISYYAKKIKYIWFYFPYEEKSKVFRRDIGELSWFWYKPQLRNEFLKSKEDKLNKFSTKNIDILFDTRDVAEKFYLKLWEVRIKLAISINDLEKDGNKLLVVQHLLDRLIFFYFLAQLGLVRIKNNEKDWKLDRKRTRQFFKWICDVLSEKDLQDFLNRIFFDVLGKVNEIGWSTEYFEIGGEKFSVTAPSLNGGLFIEKEFEGKNEREIKINGIRELILDVLNKYNWILGEELPEEEDVIGDLTPEIIGHIYEKFVVSLEKIGLEKIRLKDIKIVKEELRYARKKIAAYYTPEKITKYISKNTIYPYIQDRLKEKFGDDGKILLKELFKKNNFNKKELEIIRYLYFEILRKIKICDNACGSGSFLIAAGNILLRLNSKIIKILQENLSDNEVKKIIEKIRESPTRNYFIVKEITTNNLYGVDIMEGAIEIAKLRFWLWLTSQIDPNKIERKRIDTLPNLDFNLMVGNSLIGFVDIEDIDLSKILRESKKLKKALYEFKGFEEFKKVNETIIWLKNLIKRKEEFKNLPTYEAIKIKEEFKEELEKARNFLNEKFYEMLKDKKLNFSKEEFLELKPFHWGFEFCEVFDLEKPKEERGFDIIIGNPPYINIYEIPILDKEIYSKTFKLRYKKYDILILFIERSIQLMNYLSHFSYITSDKWVAEEYGLYLRKFISENRNIKEIVDFEDYHVFDEPKVYNVIFILTKQKFDKIIIKSKDFSIKNILSYEFIKKHPKLHLRLDMGSIEKEIIDFILSNKIMIKDICYVNWGCRPSPSKEYIFDKYEECLKVTKDEKKCKKLIKGSNIRRYGLNPPIKWLAYLPSMYNPMFPDLFENDRIIIKDIGIKPLKANFLSGKDKIYSDHTTINLILYKNLPRKKKEQQNSIKFFDVNLKYLLSLINSKLINFYIWIFLSDRLHVLPENTKQIPIVIHENMKILTVFCDYMLFLNEKEERKKSEEELIEFIDRQIIDPLVYELYFKEKFEEDGIKVNLLKLVEPHLKNIENIKSDEDKLKIIKQVVDKIKNDEKIMKEIDKIKNHKWVKIIEGLKT